MRRLIITFTILTWMSCDNSKSHTVNDEKRNNLGDTLPKCQAPFRTKDPFDVLNMKTTSNYPSSSTDRSICNGWTLMTSEIQTIIKESEVISGPDWHHLFDHLPCSISGQLRQSSTTFEFQINGGSWLTITCGDSTQRFGYLKTDSKRLFISPPLDAETGI
jgi:hypothetical protein